MAVLDVIARQELPLAKSGGLAIRDLARLAKTAVVEPVAARMTLEIADAAGPIRPTPASSPPPGSSSAGDPRRHPGGTRSCCTPGGACRSHPSEAEDDDGKAIRPLLQPVYDGTLTLSASSSSSSCGISLLTKASDSTRCNQPCCGNARSSTTSIPLRLARQGQVWSEAEMLGLIAMEISPS